MLTEMRRDAREINRELVAVVRGIERVGELRRGFLSRRSLTAYEEG